jgi:hypothetical protein
MSTSSLSEFLQWGEESDGENNEGESSSSDSSCSCSTQKTSQTSQTQNSGPIVCINGIYYKQTQKPDTNQRILYIISPNIYTGQVSETG